MSVDILEAFERTLKSITNLVGIIEANLKSADNIRSHFKKKSALRRLVSLQSALHRIHQDNRQTLILLAKLAEKPDRYGRTWEAEEDEWRQKMGIYSDSNKYILERDFSTFAESLASLQEIADSLVDDNDLVDYQIFSAVQDAIADRQVVLEELMLDQDGMLSRERFAQLAELYERAVSATEELKALIQGNIKELS